MSRAITEKNKLENIDLMQIEYFSDLPISNRDIVVIEYCNPIAITIRKFLVSLGFENIYICKEPDEGINIFSDFVSKEISVPIIIDDSLPNQDLENTIRELLEIYPGVKIIVITAKEKTDPRITKFFDMGIGSITQKPLEMTDLKKSLSNIFEQKDSWKNITCEEKFELLLSSGNIISENKIKRFLNVEQSEIETLLRNAKENQRIILDKEILEVACNQCKSPTILYSSKFPNVNKSTLHKRFS